ncbi:MAG: O-antigen ligase family protein [Woeseiaceae bacterium]
MHYLLALFFFILYTGDNLGLNISLGPGMSVKNLILYLIFAGIAINSAVARNRKIEIPGVVVPFGLLIVYALVTWFVLSFILMNPDYGVRESFIRLKSSEVDQLLMLLVFFYGTIHEKDTYWLLRAVLWIVMLGNVITLVDALDIPNLGIVEAKVRNDRFLGFLGSANGYGQFLVLFLPACVALYLNCRGKARLLAGIGLFSTAISLVLTGSRGAYVGLLAGSFLAAIFLRKTIPTKTIIRAGIASMFLCAVVVVAALVTDYGNVVSDSMGKFEGSTHVATSGRSTIWGNALAAMVEYPVTFLTGFGFNAYESAGRFYAATHNTYLNYLYNLGSIGVLLFLLPFAGILATARSALESAHEEWKSQFFAMVFGLLAFLVSIFFGEYHQSTYMLWAYLGIVMRMVMQVRDRAEPAIGEYGTRSASQMLPDGRPGYVDTGLDNPTWAKREM